MTTKQIATSALFLSLLIAAGVIAVPLPGLPVPVLVQNMVVMLTAGLLDRKSGLVTISTFLALVALGLPLLAGGRGGAAVFVGPSAGFLLGYWLSPLVLGSWPKHSLLRAVCGYVVMALLIDGLGGLSMGISAGGHLLSGFAMALTFVPLDLAKALMAAWLTVRLQAGVRLTQKN